MLKNVSIFWYRISTPKTIFIFLGLFIAFAFLMAISSLSTKETPFDLKFGYDLEFTKNFLGSLTVEQRKSYITFLLAYDFLYPIVYGGLLITLISYFNPSKNQSLVNLLPLIIIISDYIENSCSIYSTLNYPEIYATIITIGSLFTMLKWSLVIASILLVLIFMILRLKRRFTI